MYREGEQSSLKLPANYIVHQDSSVGASMALDPNHFAGQNIHTQCDLEKVPEDNENLNPNSSFLTRLEADKASVRKSQDMVSGLLTPVRDSI